MEEPVHFRVPRDAQLRNLRRILRAHRVARQRRVELLQRLARIGNHRNRPHLVRIELRSVDVDEPHRRILKCRHRGRSEIGVARANADHQIGRIRQAIRCQCARGSDRAHLLRMIPLERPFARLGFRHRNSGLRHEIIERQRSLAHQHSASGHNQWPFGAANRRYRTLQRNAVRLPAPDQPHAFFKELFWIVVRFGLHILRQRQCRRAAIGW